MRESRPWLNTSTHLLRPKRPNNERPLMKHPDHLTPGPRKQTHGNKRVLFLPTLTRAPTPRNLHFGAIIITETKTTYHRGEAYNLGSHEDYDQQCSHDWHNLDYEYYRMV